MAARKKSAEVAMPSYKPTLHLDGKTAAGLRGHQVGARVRMIVEGTVTSQSVSKFDGKRSHSTSIEVSRVRRGK